MPSDMRRPDGAQLALDWTLDPLEARTLALLRARVGREQAIRVPDLAELIAQRIECRVSPRETQEIVRRLRERHGCPILSSAGKPPGYWWCASPTELRKCIAEQRAKAISTLIVLRALRRHLAGLMGQVQLPEQKDSPRG